MNVLSVESPFGAARGAGKVSITPHAPRRRRSARLEADQSSADSDQTASDTDQTASDTDQSLADRDQAASEADQQVSDRDQATSDRELEAQGSAGPDLLRAHDRARASRGEGTMARMATTAVRAQIASERHEQAEDRDEIAQRRDEAAATRDREAEAADAASEELASQLGKDSPAAKVAAVARASAAAARARAAKDRERAASDRAAAARDRELLMGEIERAHTDEATGAYGRQIGEILLRHEVERAQRMKKAVSLGILSVVEAAPAAGPDAREACAVLLEDCFQALRSQLRPYDPIVRWGEDELLFAVAEVPPGDSEQRLDAARADAAERHPRAPIATGLATLKDGDTLGKLVARAKDLATRPGP